VREFQWLRGRDARRMLGFAIMLRPFRPRKLRLFSCGCVRKISHLLSDPIGLMALELAERMADEGIKSDEIAVVRKDAYRIASLPNLSDQGGAEAIQLAAACLETNASSSAHRVCCGLTSVTFFGEQCSTTAACCGNPPKQPAKGPVRQSFHAHDDRSWACRL
jgi:hypothetical protein